MAKIERNREIFIYEFDSMNILNNKGIAMDITVVRVFLYGLVIEAVNLNQLEACFSLGFRVRFCSATQVRTCNDSFLCACSSNDSFLCAYSSRSALR